MDSKATGDGALVPNRVSEKSDLQNLNQRLAAYIDAIRSAQEREMRQRTIYNETRSHAQPDDMRAQYEIQITELQAKLEALAREKHDLDMNRTRYDTSVSDYENRIISLNETLFEKQNELQRLYGALATKDVELQEARADATQPRMALDSVRMEAEDYRKRLEESERRLNLEIHTKNAAQEQLVAIENRMTQEIIIHQQEMTEMKNKLENSHQLILKLEDKVRKAGQADSGLAEMMRKVREASEVELRRFMEETEAKYNLNIQEVKLRMDADVENLAAMAEENGRLQAQIGSQAADIRTLEAKLTVMETQRAAVASDLENEKSSFQSQIRNLERKLQETQDLLLVKIQELGAAQEANIPLRAEINALKALMEEEEKRLNLMTLSPESPFIGSTSIHKLSTSHTFADTLDDGGKGDGFVASASPRDGFSSNRLYGTSSYQRETNAATSFPLPDGKIRRRPASVPTSLHGLRRAGSNAQVSHIPLATPTYAPSGTGRLMNRNSVGIENRYVPSSSDSVSSQIIDLKADGANRRGSADLSIEDLPPRPDNPTPTRLPKRPASATNSRYIPAAKGHGKDYFDAMFNDVRKDSLYSKVTEKDCGPATAQVSSVNWDYANSMGSATGNLKVLQVADDGSCVRVTNTSSTQEESIGGFMLQQNVGGHPVAVFRFPPRSSLLPGNSTTVWSAKAVNGVHDPPHHYVWAKLDKWGTGPECTTILCRPNGQAVAWMTSAPRRVKAATGIKHAPDVKQQTEETKRLLEDMRVKNQFSEQGSGDEADSPRDEPGGEGWKPDPVTLPASYTSKPTMYRDGPYSPKPNPVIKRPKSTPIGTRTPASAGLLPSRTGSAPLHLHHPKSSQVSGKIYPEAPAQSDYIPPWSVYYDPDEYPNAIKSAPPVRLENGMPDRGMLQSAPAGLGSQGEVERRSPGQSARMHLPGTFWAPAEQHKKGMEWIQSQHNVKFLPPMPKNFPCVRPVYRAASQMY